MPYDAYPIGSSNKEEYQSNEEGDTKDERNIEIA
jgi:hypothetical protein